MLHAKNPNSLTIDAIIKNAASYLRKQQLPSGGFTSASLPTKYAKQGDVIYQTVFFPSLILSALHVVHAPEIDVVKSRITLFLQSQKNEDWSYNYWDRNSGEYTHTPYPDDLDDTFCALAALQLHDPHILTASDLAVVAKLLIATEVQEGGPYKTWLTSAKQKVWQDVDIAVNANIAYFLSLQDVGLPSIQDLIDKAIQNNALKSPYYPNAYPIDYFIARWYQGTHKKTLIHKIWSRKQGPGWGHPQRTALAVTSLLNLGFPAHRLLPAIEYLKHLQQFDGSWEAEAFCIDPSQSGSSHYGSSTALSTALCLEALSRYHAAIERERVEANATTHHDGFKEKVLMQIDNRIAEVNQPELQAGLYDIKQRILLQEENFQLIKLPVLIANAAHVLPDESMLVQLACISMWGWMAYSTYDDFLDGEGKTSLLPAANVCLRNLVTALQRTLPEVLELQDETSVIMDRLDAANTWEMIHCRPTVKGNKMQITQLPDYADNWQLADRSLGHTIAALGVLYAVGEPADSPRLHALREFFHHYLIARQLNDDAHDWFDDLRAGHVNAVAAKMLAKMYGNNPIGGITFDIEAQKSVLQELLWKEIIDEVCADIMTHVERARRAVHVPHAKFDTELFEKILTPIQQAAAMALTKRNEALEFIAALK